MSDQNREFWLSLHAACGGSAAAGEILRAQPNISPLFADGPDALQAAEALSPASAALLRRAAGFLPKARQALLTCRKNGWAVITPDDADYPMGFRLLKDPPLAVFCAGDTSLLRAEKTAAVVGTRKPSPQSEIAAYRLGQAFSEHGVVTVSGGALGIDSASHEGALSGPGTTIAVLGNGFGYNYLAEKRFMRRRIQARGLLVTEQFPDAKPTYATFPLRNRLIVALGQTLTVVQSAEKGGSMNSASYALFYGCRLFVLSGKVFFSPGCEALIAKGAVPVADAADVLEYYGVKNVCVPLENDGAPLPGILDPAACTLAEFAALNGASVAEIRPLYNRLASVARQATSPGPEKAAPAPTLTPLEQTANKAKTADEKGLSGDMRAVFLALDESPVGLDDLAAQTGLSPSQVMTAVTLLELEGLAQTLPGDRVQLINN